MILLKITLAAAVQKHQSQQHASRHKCKDTVWISGKAQCKMVLFPRQLNPWKRRANVSVANAIVDAIAAPFPFPI